MKDVLLSDVADTQFSSHERPLGPQERMLLRHLIDRDYMRMDEAIDLLWSHCEDGGPLWSETQVKVKIFYIRRRLLPGWYIETHYRLGWRLVRYAEMDIAA